MSKINNMHNHAPLNYECPFCRIAKGIEDENLATTQKDIFYRSQDITAFISSHAWPNNQCNTIIIPNQHIENIYNLPTSLSHQIHDFEKKLAIALKKVLECDGISSRQHNEPAGNQDVWHYHLHIIPRYENDKLYQLHNQKNLVDKAERVYFANKLKNYFSEN